MCCQMQVLKLRRCLFWTVLLLGILYLTVFYLAPRPSTLFVFPHMSRSNALSLPYASHSFNAFIICAHTTYPLLSVFLAIQVVYLPSQQVQLKEGHWVTPLATLLNSGFFDFGFLKDHVMIKGELFTDALHTCISSAMVFHNDIKERWKETNRKKGSLSLSLWSCLVLLASTIPIHKHACPATQSLWSQHQILDKEQCDRYEHSSPRSLLFFLILSFLLLQATCRRWMKFTQIQSIQHSTEVRWPSEKHHLSLGV